MAAEAPTTEEPLSEPSTGSFYSRAFSNKAASSTVASPDLDVEVISTLPKDNKSKTPWWKKLLLLLLPLSGGLAVPCIGAINSNLTPIIGSTYWSVSWAYGSGGLILSIFAATTGRSPPIGSGVKNVVGFVGSRYFNFFVLFAGICGILQNVIISEGTTKLGAGLLTLGMLLGQIVASLVLDITGWVWADKVGFALLGLVGCASVAIGCVLYQLQSFIGDNSDALGPTSTAIKVLYVCLSVLNGISVCIQSTLCGQMAKLIGRVRRACAWAYISGTIVCVILAASLNPNPSLASATGSDWWKFMSAPFNIYTLVVATICPSLLSFSATFSYIIVGQLVGSTFIDGFGLFNLPTRPIDVYNYVGIVVVLFGVYLVAMGRKRLLARLTAPQVDDDPKV